MESNSLGYDGAAAWTSLNNDGFVWWCPWGQLRSLHTKVVLPTHLQVSQLASCRQMRRVHTYI